MAILFSIHAILWLSQTIHLTFDISEMLTDSSKKPTTNYKVIAKHLSKHFQCLLLTVITPQRQVISWKMLSSEPTAIPILKDNLNDYHFVSGFLCLLARRTSLLMRRRPASPWRWWSCRYERYTSQSVIGGNLDASRR